MTTTPDPTEIVIAGQPYQAVFTWGTYAELRERHGVEPDYMNPAVLADALSLALKAKHPMVTAEQIMVASPPMVAAAMAVKSAITRVFLGDQQPPDQTTTA